ncbi:hypothetical protein EGX94_05725 [Propionibacterium acidifaciens]|nr:hypothetical protein EGX94_05725 [Propionibacterium acidifaciens]
MLLGLSRVWVDGSVSLGGWCWRRRSLVFSLLPRCRGLWGSQKNEVSAVSMMNLACRAISVPWSQVGNHRCSRPGGRPMARVWRYGDPVAL